MSDLQRVGPVIGSTGTPVPFTADVTGAQRVTDGHAKYYDPTSRRTMFNGAIVGQVTTVGLATTYTGLVLVNPIGSGYNLVINKAGYAFIVAFAAGSAVGLMTGYNGATDVTLTTPVTVRSNYVNGMNAAGVGKLASAATLPTAPVLNTVLSSGLTGAITTAVQIPSSFDVDGSIVLAPGGYCAFYTSTASGAGAGAFSFTWEEVPLIV